MLYSESADWEIRERTFNSSGNFFLQFAYIESPCVLSYSTTDADDVGMHTFRSLIYAF